MLSSKLGCMFFITGILFQILPYFPASCETKSKGNTKIRVVTWNVADNSKMGGNFTDAAIDKVLGLDQNDARRPAIYAIGLEENCWKCDVGNMAQIGDRFVARINAAVENEVDAVTDNHYTVIGIRGTRMSSKCEFSCTFNTHGTTAVLVIAKDSMVVEHSEFTHNVGCHGAWVQNVEKGIAAMKIVLNGGQTLCFGAGHLDSSKSKYRRQCFKNFFDTAKEEKWSNCTSRFIFGDFNTRTGDKNDEPKKGIYVSKQTHFDSLKDQDELAGSKPYGTDDQWKGNLLSYVNSIQDKKFKECSFKFLPTYSILSAKEFCNGKFPCYRNNRPKSWTDRIIFNNPGGKCLKYDAVYAEYGDHYPVFGEYLLDF